MRGLILVNAYSRMRAFDVQSSRLQEAFESIGVEADVRRNDGFIARIEDGEVRVDAEGYRFCVYLDKDKYVLKALESSGIPVFNRFSAIEACDDKMATCLALAGHGFRIPKTLPGMLCYDPGEPVKDESVDKVVRSLGLPVVVKECFGSMGKGVRLARSREELKKAMEDVKLVPHLFQEFVSSSSGRDLRVIVVGGKALGAMLRSSESDFRSNIGCGGIGKAFPLDAKTAACAERIAAVLDLDYCGVDLLFPEDGDMIVCEVNSNAFFEAFESCTGIDVARAYAEHVVDEVVQMCRGSDRRRYDFIILFRDSPTGIALDPDGIMAWFEGLAGRGVKPGLDNIRKLLSLLGNPHEGLRAVHVAGSDGKGSVCAMIESVLNASGLRTGAFTSPHVLEVNECIRLGGEPVSDVDLDCVLSKIRPAVDGMAAEGMECTQFEVLTAAAFEYFSMVEADIAVVEVGMGGAMDCTNVIRPEVVVINNVGREHAAALGGDVAHIAAHKAGVMKPGVPCVTMNGDEVFSILESRAKAVGCPLKRVDPGDIEVLSNRVDSVEMLYKGEMYVVGLPGRMQSRNAAVAIEALSLLQDFAESLEANLSKGLAEVSWPCRMQKIMGMPLIVDVTHTLDGARCLCEDIEEIYGQVTVVMGLLSDKDIRGISKALAGIASKVFVAPPRSPRAADVAVMEEAMREFHDDVTACGTVAEALELAMEARGDGNILVTGSFRTAEDALRWMQEEYAKS